MLQLFFCVTNLYDYFVLCNLSKLQGLPSLLLLYMSQWKWLKGNHLFWLFDWMSSLFEVSVVCGSFTIVKDSSILLLLLLLSPWFNTDITLCSKLHTTTGDVKFSKINQSKLNSYVDGWAVNIWHVFLLVFDKRNKLGEFTMVSQPIRLILVDWFVF
jgi:hypothetical protein